MYDASKMSDDDSNADLHFDTMIVAVDVALVSAFDDRTERGT